MSWLAPLYLIGLTAVALPIVFHLLRRAPRGRVPFSTLMFLAPSPPRLARWTRLENLWLLLLRASVLVLLALAFARPFLRQSASLDTEQRARRRVAILIDTSASMRRLGLWQQASAEVEQALAELRPGDDAALYAFDQQPRVLVPFSQGGALDLQQQLGRLRAGLRPLRPTWADSDLGKALVAVADDLHATADSSQQSAQTLRCLVLVSDLAQGSRLDDLQAYQWPGDVELAVRPVTAANPTNAGLHLAGERPADTEPGQSAAVRVRVSNDRDSEREEFVLRWAVPGRADAVDQPITVYVPPGESRVVRVPRPAEEAAAQCLVLTGDAHDFDNALYLAPVKPEEITLLYIGREASDDAQGLLYYFQRAFVDTPARKIQTLARSPSEPISADDLAAARLIAVGSALGDELAASLRQRLRSGGTVLYVLADADGSRPLGRLMGPARLPVDEVKSADYGMLAWIDFTHPLFAALADPRFNDFTKIRFWRHRRVDFRDAPETQILARFDDGSPALVEQTQDKGRLLVLTAGWHPADSQLARSSKFVPLMSAVLERAGVTDAALPQYQVGDRAWLARWHAAAAGATVRKPDGAVLRVAQGAQPPAATDQPGIYRVAMEGREEYFAVNLAPAESQTAPLPVEQLEQYGARLSDRQTREQLAAAQRQMRANELENSQKLWRWLLAAALGVLVLETLHAGALARRVGNVGQVANLPETRQIGNLPHIPAV